jgi:hypothetical protein
VELIGFTAVSIAPQQMEASMADGGGGATGILGVLVGAILVIFIGAALLSGGFGKGGGGGSSSNFTIKLPGAR